jgi:hypothetical protein
MVLLSGNNKFDLLNLLFTLTSLGHFKGAQNDWAFPIGDQKPL